MKRIYIHIALSIILTRTLIDAASSAVTIRCYSCVQSLAPEVDEEAKKQAKIFFAKNFNLPPASSVCNDPKDHSFLTLDKLDCRDSVCTKITVHAGDQTFMIRGCKSTVYRDKPQPPSCGVSLSPSYCDCSTDLCNGGNSIFFLSSFVFYSVLFVLVLVFYLNVIYS